jgi:hypothetical protein
LSINAKWTKKHFHESLAILEATEERKLKTLGLCVRGDLKHLNEDGRGQDGNEMDLRMMDRKMGINYISILSYWLNWIRI